MRTIIVTHKLLPKTGLFLRVAVRLQYSAGNGLFGTCPYSEYSACLCGILLRARQDSNLQPAD